MMFKQNLHQQSQHVLVPSALHADFSRQKVFPPAGGVRYCGDGASRFCCNMAVTHVRDQTDDH